ncbi:MAG TPA: thioredoxin family protein [Rhodothermales bacterium]|nr:thioredoxin family protein [Rhodothermales bacterium]
MNSFFANRRPHEGLTYEAYRAQWLRTTQQPLTGLDRVARKYVFYSRYNWERAERVHAAYAVSARLRKAIAHITQPNIWMVLTEDWCVDSAFSLPVIVEAARLNPHIDVRMLLRDKNLDIMDQYLTNGGRSIPKLVAFAQDGTELFTWGPRPAAAQQVRAELIASGLNGAQVSAALVTWYDDGGWQQVDAELADALESVYIQ